MTLVHQLIHMQIRFLQMEFPYGKAMRFRVEDILAKPVNFLPAIMRELDRLPTKIKRTRPGQCKTAPGQTGWVARHSR